MAEVKVVRGTLGGATVQTSERVAELLGSAFEPEKKASAKPAAKKTAPAADKK